MQKLIIICGLSFAGKSTLGAVIAQNLGYEQVDVDETKVRLYGADITDDELKHEDWVKIYDETDKQIKNYLESGKSVVDASRNFRKAEREKIKELVKRLGYETSVIYVNTPEHVVRQRWIDNKKQQTRRDIVEKDFEEIIQVMEIPHDEAVLIFHYEDDMNDWIVKQSEILR